MRGIHGITLGLLIGGLCLACAGNPKPGDSGYRFNVTGPYTAHFDVSGQPYDGTMTLATARGGTVTGSMALVSPATINSQVTGTVLADTLRLSIPYATPDGCGGTAALIGTIAEGGAAANGTMDVQDSCGGALEGTFTLSR
jgi:hypothetical protein